MTDSNWYSTVFKNKFTAQGVKQLGPRPTDEMLATVHGLGARPGKQALAIAMGLRDCGVTGSQIIMACGAQQLNKMRGYIVDAHLKRLATPNDASGHTVYKLELTPKGAKRVEATAKARAALEAAGNADETAKPAKKASRKSTVKAARKAKVKAVTEALPVNEPLATVNTDDGATVNETTIDNQPQA